MTTKPWDSWDLVWLTLKPQDLLGPVKRVKKKKEKNPQHRDPPGFRTVTAGQEATC